MDGGRGGVVENGDFVCTFRLAFHQFGGITLNMSGRAQTPYTMPDVPGMDFIDAISEMWFVVSYAAYHLAYVRVYLQTEALQTDIETIRKQEQALRDAAQIDTVICRAHLAAFFWQIEHFFEALHAAINRGKKEHPDLQYFFAYEKIEEENPTCREINAYRNIAHSTPGIIGCSWEGKGGKFLHHHLPTIAGYEKKESVDINTDLQRYFEFVANIWLAFAPGDLKDKFPRNFMFPITVPNTFNGELPPDLTRVPQLHVSIEAYEKSIEPTAAEQPKQ